VDGYVSAIRHRGFAWIRNEFRDSAEAFEAARELIAACCTSDGSAAPVLIGDFVLPPVDGPSTRGFQTLHFDFGLPLAPRFALDLARYTALQIPVGHGGTTALTRLVPLAGLLSQRHWPARPELLQRLSAYGSTHGAWDDARGYVEGSLARLVEAAAGAAALPSVKTEPGFMCGTEFGNLRAEIAFFERHALRLQSVEIEVGLRPGELLVFDNLSLAHGRRGARRPGELRQWVFGERGLDVVGQRAVREAVLSAFERRPNAGVEASAGASSIP
jgi:hypothetical protein